jgi:hypothetical protein
MKQELQTPAPWINSRHNPELEPEQSPDNQDDWLLEDIMRLESQADTAISIAMFLGGLLVMILMVGYIMWVNNLIVH